jgi:hypothetical protein
MKFIILVKFNRQLEANIGDMNRTAMKQCLGQMHAFSGELALPEKYC